MRTIRSISAAAFAVLMFAGAGMAQEKPSALLDTLVVRQLVARGEPADSARLSAHFTALAEQYAAEARRHESMAKSFSGNPSRNLGAGMSGHCARLADLNTQGATTLRELAAYHAKLASGVPAVKPGDAAPFEKGKGAPAPTTPDLNALAAKASTPADHRVIEEYFVMLAERNTARAKEHATLAMTYRGTRMAPAGTHHDRLAQLARDEAKEATDAAAMHKQLANIGR
jgi:hypothetical protein